MSRMLAYIADRRTEFLRAVGERVAGDFASLSRLHADGWGTAWPAAEGPRGRSGGMARAVAFGGFPEALGDVPPAAARLFYLRFASRGSAVEPANVQPFVADGIAFQHNGALAPAALLRERLEVGSVAGLTGSADSELYFARIRERIGRHGPLEAALRTVAELRGLYPHACLNAMMLTPDGLVVTQSSGRRGVPLDAFEVKGFGPGALPPEHDHRYNRLAWRPIRSSSGAGNGVVVASSGVRTDDWNHFDDETVTVFPYSATAPRSVRV